MVYSSPWAQPGHLAASSSLVINFLSQNMHVCLCMLDFLSTFLLNHFCFFCTLFSSLSLSVWDEEVRGHSLEGAVWLLQRDKECWGQIYTQILHPSPKHCTHTHTHRHAHIHVQAQNTHTRTHAHTHMQTSQMYKARVGYINQMAVAGMKQLWHLRVVWACVCVCVCVEPFLIAKTTRDPVCCLQPTRETQLYNYTGSQHIHTQTSTH